VRPVTLTKAVVEAAQEMDAAQRRIVEARKRLAAANRKYAEYTRRNPVA
jgi:hypothetical protein